MRFVDRRENILFIGSPGVGKTHLSVSIGIEAAYNHRSTYFISCNDMLLNLKRAQLENRLEQKKLLDFLKLSPIPLDDVLLKPTLFKKK